MQSRAINLLITLAALFFQSDGGLTNTPQDTESKVGNTTYFNCSTNLTSKEILWNHGDKYVYSENGILPPYDKRFEIERNESIGSYNLVIHSVEPSDAGEYICIDDDGHGIRRAAQLIVIDDDLNCQSNIQPDGVIGQNVFNIPPDEVQLTCNVIYHGNVPPLLEWRKVGDNSSAKFNVTSQLRSGNRLTHTLNLKGDISLDKSSYVCQTKRSRQKQYKCISKVIKVLYFIGGNGTEQNPSLHVFRGDQITCIDSNNTFQCTREWHHDNYTCPLSCAETITTHLLGEYLCKTKCNVRGTEHFVDTMKAFVAEAPASPPPSTEGTVAASVVAAMVALVALSLIAVGIHVRKSTHKEVIRMRKMKRGEEKSKKRNKQELTIEYVEIEIELRHKIPKSEEKTILGVAILGDNIFLVHKENPYVEVYDCKDFSVDFKTLHVEKVVSPLDICSSKENNCLYIMDTKDFNFDEKEKFEARKVFKINANGNILKKWSTKNDACGFLSANKGGNVIITVQDGHMLLEYTYDGKLVRYINLPACIRPWHAIKRGDDDYIVCHGTYDHLHRVCLVKENGQVDKSFGDEIGSAANQLHIPYYLAVGSSGYVLVADLCNNRVLLLDKDLKFTANIVPKYNQRFQFPRRIYLDEDLRVLIVVIGAGIPQKMVSGDTSDLKEDIGQVQSSINSDYTKISIHGEAQESRQETEGGTTSKDSWDKTEETRKLIEAGHPLKTGMKETDVLERIEESCGLLVFDIQPLMQFFTSSKSQESCL